MKQYLVLIPPGSDDASLVEELEQLAAQEPSRFHVVVVRNPAGSDTGERSDEQRLGAALAALTTRGLAADGEVGQRSVVGSVARVAEPGRYDALVVPVPDTGGLETLDLDVARRLHQIEIPELILLTPRGKRPGPTGPRRRAGRQSRRPRGAPARTALLGISLVVLVAAAVLVPLPVVELRPGPAIDVPPLVRVGHATRPVTGRLLLLTVNLSEPSTTGVLRALVSHHRELLPRWKVIPAGVDPRQYDRAERAVFDESARVAAAVGVSAAGYPVHVTGGGARVVAVVPGSPAAEILRVGDVITAVDGRPTPLASDVEAALAPLPIGRRITVLIQRGDATLDQVIPVRPVGALGQIGLGVAIRTVAERMDLPFPVTVNASQIGGPSAGLMMALAIYDLVGPGDLTRGRVIAGTGTINVAGAVGPIGGIAEKVVAAEHTGATIFLAPASQAAAARQAAGGRLQVIPVSTFAAAVDALCSSAATTRAIRAVPDRSDSGLVPNRPT